MTKLKIAFNLQRANAATEQLWYRDWAGSELPDLILVLFYVP